MRRRHPSAAAVLRSFREGRRRLVREQLRHESLSLTHALHFDGDGLQRVLDACQTLLDHRIVEFAASLPEEMKIRGSGQKMLLRALMKDKLPASILNRKKIGFDDE